MSFDYSAIMLLITIFFFGRKVKFFNIYREGFTNPRKQVTVDTNV
jgi:hypothetical protein